MPKFVVERTFSLAWLGDQWKDCFIKFQSVSIRENTELISHKLGSQAAEEIVKVTTKFLQDHFIDGVAFDSEKNEITKLTKENLVELPALIQEKAITFLVGGNTQ